MLKVGFVGWRGMVGSVLMERMQQSNDFLTITPSFFSTSNSGGIVPKHICEVANIPVTNKLLDAYKIEQLLNLNCIVSSQGSDYTNEILPKLRLAGYDGYYLDASSALRMDEDSIIVLDPLNRDVIDKGLASGIKNYVGGNCTVSLMLMGLAGLFKANLVEWISSMTYQAASGAGANNMRELLLQSGQMYNSVAKLLVEAESDILAIDRQVNDQLNSPDLAHKYFGHALSGNVLPWIDSEMKNGQTREEWKGVAETNKILGLAAESIKVDGVCVRVGSMRCHSQGLTIKLRNNGLSIPELEEIIKSGNQWVKYVANNKKDTLEQLTPVAVSDTLDVAVGRLKKLNFGEEYISIFTVGDQLLWGAAEPIRRMLKILVDYHG